MRHTNNTVGYRPPRTAIPYRFVAVGRVAVFHKQRLHCGVQLVDCLREIVYKTLDVRFKDLCQITGLSKGS